MKSVLSVLFVFLFSGVAHAGRFVCINPKPLDTVAMVVVDSLSSPCDKSGYKGVSLYSKTIETPSTLIKAFAVEVGVTFDAHKDSPFEIFRYQYHADKFNFSMTGGVCGNPHRDMSIVMRLDGNSWSALSVQCVFVP